MNGSGDEDFAVEEFFRGHLDEGGAGFYDEHNADDGEEKEGVGHHGDDAEASAEREGAGVAHHKAGRRDVEPDVGKKPTDDGETEAKEHPLPLEESDNAISTVGEHHEAAGETIETIADVGGVASGDDGESKEGDHADDADFYATDKGNHDGGPAELDSEEPAENGADDGDEEQLGTGAKTSGAFATAEDVDEVIYEADRSTAEKASEREPCLPAVEIANESDGGDDDNTDDAGHGGEVSLELVRVELGHDGQSFSLRGGLFLFFPELIFGGKIGVYRREEHGEQKSAKCEN